MQHTKAGQQVTTNLRGICISRRGLGSGFFGARGSVVFGGRGDRREGGSGGGGRGRVRGRGRGGLGLKRVGDGVWLAVVVPVGVCGGREGGLHLPARAPTHTHC